MDSTLPGYGLIAVLNNQQIDERDKARAGDLAPPSHDPHAHLVGRLSAYLSTCWEAAKSAKSRVEQEMLEDLRQREGVYSPGKLAAIREQGGSEIYMMLTNMKCRAAEGWLRDVLFPPGERPFFVKPSPIPDLSPDLADQMAQFIVQEARDAIESGIMVTPREVFERSSQVAQQVKDKMRAEAERLASMMEEHIDDVLIEGRWYEAMEAMLGDLVTLPAGIIKGPVVRKQTRLKWGQDPRSGSWAPAAEDELVPMFYSPSPLDIYPAPDSRGPEDGYLFERIPVRRSALHAMIGVPGYKEDAIRAALQEYRKGYSCVTGVEQQRRDLENTANWQLSPDLTLDMLEFHGSAPGSLLIEWGVEPERVPDPDAEYEITAAMIGRFVIRCVLNEDPMKRRPYMIAHYDRIKGQFWGRGLPRIIRDLQDMCNAAARALVNNMGLASGPMVEVEADRLAEGESLTAIYPWRMFQTKASKTTPAPAVRFHNIPSQAQELIGVYQYFSTLADHYSGIHSYDSGINPTRGAAGTASGLSMLMNASSRQVKRVVASVDAVTEGSVERTHTYIMLYDPDDSAKGDVNIEARGASSLVAKEAQQLRRTEFLMATANPIDMQIIGPEGRAEMLREAVKAFDMNTEKIVPNRDEVLRRVRQAMAQAIPQQPQAPAGMLEAGAPAGPVGAPAGGPASVMVPGAA